MTSNWFHTLNDALNSEGLIESWGITNQAIGYNETVSWTWDNGTKYGHYISIYRNDSGMYERPISYAR